MSFSSEDLKSILQQQQANFEESQLRLIQTLAQCFNIQPSLLSQSGTSQTACDSIAATISDFHYEPASGLVFDSWYKRWEDTFQNEFTGKEDAWKARLLVRKLGTVEHDRFVNFILPKQPKDLNFTDTVEQLREIFGEQISLFNVRYNCLKLAKRDADDYVTFAGIVNRDCEKFQLQSLTEDQFKCLIFIAGLQSSQDADIRTRLLAKLENQKDITVKTLTTECQRLLNLKHDTAMVQQSTKSYNPTNVQALTHATTVSGKRPPTSCWSCGEWHYARFCPFKKHQCQKCHRYGHKEGFCHSQITRTSKAQQFVRNSARDTLKKQPYSKRPQSNSVLATFNIEFVSRRKYITISINNIPVRLQLDTASDITLISRSTWDLIGKPVVSPSTHQAQSASGNTLQLTGVLTCDVSFNNFHFSGTCYLTDRSNLNLIGLDWIEKLDLFNVPLSSVCNSLHHLSTSDTANHFTNILKKKFDSVFQDGLGCCTKFKATLKLQPSARPVFRPKRPVPYAALETVEKELDRLEKSGVIQPVNYSTWAAPIVVIKKANGKIRICADYSTGLNAVLDAHQYPLPVPEDLFTKLNGGTCFAKLDLADAYLQVEVSDDSKELLTVNTHRGLFQFNRLPFGVKSAPAIFQQTMDAMLTGLSGVAAYLDDIIVTGSSQDELLTRLNCVLDRIQQYGFRLRSDKCAFFLSSIKYLGFIFDKHGRHPDPENICAIKQMPPPTDLPTLRSFLGLVSHYSTFLPDMHCVRDPLNRLLQKDVLWNWSPECQSAFDKVKSLLSSDLLLTHYNPSMDITVVSDASNYGIGAVISHVFPDGTEKAIAHAARSLTSTERNYGQIEKEALAIIFAVKKFHKMLYGRHFTLITDHKPLLGIFGSKKGIPVYTANRLQRWATMLLSYDFSIKYKSTHAIGQADALSRLIDSQRKQPEDAVVASIAIESEISTVLATSIRALPVTSSMIRDATARDPLLQSVIHFHRTKWPQTCPDKKLLPFYQRRSSISEVDGCILFSERVVVPPELQDIVLKQFHFGHPGINRMKALARSYVYWPSMDKQLEDLVRTCSNCQLSAKSPRKTELRSWPIPETPWSRIHIDFAGPINGQHYLILVDAYSKWPEVFSMDHITSCATIMKLQHVFSRFGVPNVLVSDNGSAFTSAEFSAFCQQNSIQHMRSPPFHPQSNGQAERFVDTFKRSLSKLKGEGTTPEIIETFLLSYRATPNANAPNGSSPAEALMNRKIRLPIDIIRPNSSPPINRNTNMERQYNRHHGATNHLFATGQSVLAKDYRGNNEKWTQGRIVRRTGNVIYEVNVQSSIWVRHANQLRPCSLPQEIVHNTNLPLEILLDTFELPYKREPPERLTAPAIPTECTPRRWTDRNRRQVIPMQVDPRQRSYENRLQRGGVRRAASKRTISFIDIPFAQT